MRAHAAVHASNAQYVDDIAKTSTIYYNTPAISATHSYTPNVHTKSSLHVVTDLLVRSAHLLLLLLLHIVRTVESTCAPQY
jgi:hypothetical protein